MSLLIDADYIVYKACAASEDEIDFGDDVIVVTSKFSQAYDMVIRELYSIAECLGVSMIHSCSFRTRKISGKNLPRLQGSSK